MDQDRGSRWADWVNDQLEERRWRAADLVRASGVKSNGRPVIDASRVKAWLAGEPPRQMELIDAAAHAFGVAYEDVLAAAGILRRRDLEQKHLERREEERQNGVSVIDAIERDPDLVPEAKQHLLNQYGLLLRLSPRVSEPVAITSRRRDPVTPPRKAAARKRTRGSRPGEDLP